MELPQIKKFRWNYLALSFLIPFLGLLATMVVAGCAPFGKSSLMSSDCWHQYFPFFKSFRQTLLSGESLLYSFHIGMGIDYLGLIAYYLASPLNLLSILVPESWLLGFFNLLIPVKLSLAGLFFAIFLKKLFGKDDLSLPLFSSFYALCAWAMGYQWNIMWLDTFALLPLVALGTVSLLRDRKFVLYTVCLFLAIFSNYYIGFFICIFVLLVFICYEICRCKSVWSFFRDLGRIALFSILAIGMTAVLELPAFAALQTTYSSVNKYPENFSLNIITGDAVTKARTAWNAFKAAKEAGEGGLLQLWWEAFTSSLPPIMEGMKKVAGNMNGGLTPTFKEGLPNLYCGVGTVIFAFLFLTCKEVKLRDKLCSVVLLLFFMVSFLLRQLDYIWHGFHFTNMIPYRFSFLFSFILLYMAYRAFLLREHFKLWQLIVAGILSIGIILCYEDLTDPVYLIYNAVFFILYTAALVYTWLQTRPVTEEDAEKLIVVQRNRSYHKGIASYILAGVLTLELMMCGINAGAQFPYARVASYPKGGAHLQTVTDYMHQREDDLYYRAEVTHAQTLNDGALIGYDGITTFTSSANVNVTKFIQKLGYAAKDNWNRYCFEESSPVSNLFLNLKYMIERDGDVEENFCFDEVYQQDSVYLLENNAYLPLGFLAESALGELDFSAPSANAFDFQNTLFTAATGVAEDVWTVISSDALTLETTGTVSISSQSIGGYCSYTSGSATEKNKYNNSIAGYLKYIYKADTAGFLCIDATMSARNKFDVKKNGQRIFFEEQTGLNQTYSACEVQPGDVVEFWIECKANEKGNTTIRAGIMDHDVFRSGYDILKASTLELTEFTNTRVEGTIHCDRNGLLYTSVPQNGENWSVTVDGQEAEIVLVGDAMIGVELTEGNHTVRLTYENKAFTAGLAVSIACLLVFLCIVFIVHYLPQIRSKGKYEK